MHNARLSLSSEDCAALTYPDKARIRRSATLAALTMVAEIAKEQGTRVAQAAWGAVSDAASSATTRGFKAVGGVIRGSWLPGKSEPLDPK